MKNSKYLVLRFISRYYRFASILIGVISIIVPLLIIMQRDKFSNLYFEGFAYLAAFIVLLVGLSIAIMLMFFSEAILVFIDIEENTRISAFNNRNFKINVETKEN